MIIRVRQLAYAVYLCTPTFIGVQMIFNMLTLTCTRYTHFSLLLFFLLLLFFFFLVFIILYCLKTYCYMCELLFICLWKRQILYSLHLFNRNPIFQFLIQIIYSLPQSSCQFRVSVRK